MTRRHQPPVSKAMSRLAADLAEGFVPNETCPKSWRLQLHRNGNAFPRNGCIGGFTLVELLVVIAIIGVLTGLLLPGLQAVRETARKSGCQHKLIGLQFAIAAYHERFEVYPAGTMVESAPVENVANGLHQGWIGGLLNQLDQPVLASRLDRSRSVYVMPNDELRNVALMPVRCPSSTAWVNGTSDYAGLHHSVPAVIDEGQDGVFTVNVAIAREQIRDGISNTIFVAEKLTYDDDLGWLSGTRSTLRHGGKIQSPADLAKGVPPPAAGAPLGSYHPGGMNALMGGGEVSFVTGQIDRDLLRRLIDRGDGGLPVRIRSGP